MSTDSAQNDVSRQTSLSDLIARRPTWEDAQRTLDLLVRRDLSDFGEPDSDLEDLTHDWGQMDLQRDAWLLCTAQGRVVGYAAVMPWASGLRFDFAVDPDWQGPDLHAALLASCEARGRSLADERYERGDGDTGLLARSYTAEGNRRMRDTLEKADFAIALYHVQMQIEMKAPPPAPQWPEGVSLRTMVPGQDDRAVHRLIQTAFERPGRPRQAFADWKEFMMRADIFQSGLWFLAIAGDDIVGACLCFAYPELGWVRQLAVAQGWRRQGLGSALLRHAFGEFYRRGFEKVGLTVASDNLDGFAFYQAVGMQSLRRYVEYQKTIPFGMTATM